MPLTFAHPAAVLPLARWLPLSALVIGAMMPDVPYFLPYIANDRFGHTLLGLFWFCVPAGGILLVAFHLLVKRSVLGLAPRGAQERFALVVERFRCASPADAGRTAVALWIGAASHVAWDSFTHRGGWGAELVPGSDALVNLGSLEIPATVIAQHVSTLVGLTVLAVAGARWYRRAPRTARDAVWPVWSRLWRLGVLVVSATAAGIVHTVTTPNLTTVEQARFFVVGATSALALGVLLYSLWASLLGRRAESWHAAE